MRRTPIVEFSQLPNAEKQKYIEFLMNNNVKFEEGGSNAYVAKIKIYADRQSGYDDENENRNSANRNSKSPRNIFMLASKIGSRSVSARAEEKETNRSPLKSIQPKIQATRVLHNAEQSYPEFYRYIKQLDIWMRPKRYSKELLMLQIEELYSSKFQEASTKIQQKKPSMQDLAFPAFVYEYIKVSTKNERATQQKAIDMLSSIEYHCIKHLEVQTFQKFLSQAYQEEDLMFYLFIRAILEKELNMTIYSRSRKTVLDLSQVYLTIKQIESISVLVYGEEELEQVSQMVQLCQDRMNDVRIDSHLKRKLSCLDFMELALQKYYADRNAKQLRFTKSEVQMNPHRQPELRSARTPTTQTQQPSVNQTISDEVFKQLQNFLQDNVGTLSVQDEIQDIIGCLLQAIFRFDKMIWFARIQDGNTNQNELLYIENLQKSYRRIAKLGGNPQEVAIFAKRVMQTPQLAKCIGKILLEGDDS